MFYCNLKPLSSDEFIAKGFIKYSNDKGNCHKFKLTLQLLIIFLLMSLMVTDSFSI